MKNSLKNFLFAGNKKDDGYETNMDLKVENKEKTYSNTNISHDDFVENQRKIDNSKPAIMTPLLYKDVEMVALELLKNKSVIVDLTNTKREEARRICDFLNGVCYALNGTVSKLSTLLYLFSPTSK